MGICCPNCGSQYWERIKEWNINGNKKCLECGRIYF